jgi:hypothetical protein
VAWHKAELTTGVCGLGVVRPSSDRLPAGVEHMPQPL